MRTSTQQAGRLLRTALGGYVVDGEAPHNYSLYLAAGDEGGIRPLQRLYRGGALEVRSRSAGRVVTALLGHLSWYAREPDEDLPAVQAMAVVRGGRAWLLPLDLRANLEHLEPALNRSGFAVVDELLPVVDPATAELVVREPVLEVDRGALGDLEGLVPAPRRAEPQVRPGRYPLTAWVQHNHDPQASPAERLMHALAHTANSDRLGLRASATRLQSLLAAVPSRSLTGRDRSGVLASLDAAG